MVSCRPASLLARYVSADMRLASRQNPGGILPPLFLDGSLPRDHPGLAPRQPWALLHNPVGVETRACITFANASGLGQSWPAAVTEHEGGTGFALRRAPIYSLNARTTRLDSLEIPSGSLTFQRLSLSSIRSTMEPSHGGWSVGDSTKRKSGPMCVMRIDAPLTINRILTWAECAP